MSVGAVALVAVLIVGTNALSARDGNRGADTAAPRGVPAERQPEAPARVRTAQQPVAAPAAAVRMDPIVAEGRTDLGRGAFVERSGADVVVHFDTPAMRTRRPEKFEHAVRSTLPAVYGAAAGAALQAMPEGSIASYGDLLTELPVRGVQLPARDGWAITVYPGTRPGEDGPLVVRYRVAVAAAR